MLGIWLTLRACAGPDGVIGIGPDEVEGYLFSNHTDEPVIFYSVHPRTGEEVEFLRLDPDKGEYEQPPYDGGVECSRIAIRARRLDGTLATEFEPGTCEPFKVRMPLTPRPG